MKNSPGSMIGGIGLTTWVRDVQFVADDRHHLVDLGVLDAEEDRRIRLLEESARAVQAGRPELLLEQRVDEGAGVLVVDDGDDELHRAEYRRAAEVDVGSDAIRAVYDAASDSDRAAGVPRGQRRSVPAIPEAASRRRSPRSPTAGDLDAALARCSPPASRPLGAGDGRDLRLRIRTEPGCSSSPSHGLDEAGPTRAGRRGQDPAHPFAAAAAEPRRRRSTARRRPTDGAFVGAYLPLIVVVAAASRWRSARSGSAGRRRATSTMPSARCSTALAALAAVAVDRARLASTAAERSEWFERMAHTDALTGLANERTVARILELELARAGRQGSEVSLAIFDVDDFQATNARRRPRGRRRCPAARRVGPRGVGPAGRHGRADRRRRVRARRARLGRRDGRAAGPRGIAALPAVAGRPITVSAGVARFPSDGADAEALDRGGDGERPRRAPRGRPWPVAGGAVAESWTAACPRWAVELARSAGGRRRPRSR